MKVDYINCLLATAICVLLGYLCYRISPEVGNQPVTAWICCSLSTLLALVPAMSISVTKNGNRNMSGKVLLWVAFFVILVTNLVFGFFEHEFAPMLITVGLEVLITAYIAYAILKK